MEHSGNTQGTLREHSGNTQLYYHHHHLTWEHSRAIEGTLRDHSADDYHVPADLEAAQVGEGGGVQGGPPAAPPPQGGLRDGGVEERGEGGAHPQVQPLAVVRVDERLHTSYTSSENVAIKATTCGLHR
jgi:hypothetical protein